MKKKSYNNTSKILRAPKDSNHPYTVVSSYWNDYSKLDGYQRAIMLELTSNSDEFIINKNVVEKRLGFPHKKFLDAWKELENKHFILCDRFWGGVRWVINENPNASSDTRIINTDVTDAQDETDGIRDTSIINTSIINTGDHLTNNKKINTKITTLESRVLKSESTNLIKTDTIQLADANCSISDQAAAAADILTYRNNSISPVLKFDFGIKDEGLDSLFDLNDFINEGTLDELRPKEIVIHKKLKRGESPLF